jgi:uncharacterized protein YbaR (Trm112 family)
MHDDSSKKQADAMRSWTGDLTCPVCFAPLHFSEATVTCAGCGRTYPIVDGIPVLIAQRATEKLS